MKNKTEPKKPHVRHECVKTNEAAAALVGISARQFSTLKAGPGFPKRYAGGWRKAELLRWAATRPGRLSALGKEGAQIQADIFNTRAAILELQEAIVSGLMIPEQDVHRIMDLCAARMRFHVQNAFEHYAYDRRDPAALDAAREAYNEFLRQMLAALERGEG